MPKFTVEFDEHTLNCLMFRIADVGEWLELIAIKNAKSLEPIIINEAVSVMTEDEDMKTFPGTQQEIMDVYFKKSYYKTAVQKEKEAKKKAEEEKAERKKQQKAHIEARKKSEERRIAEVLEKNADGSVVKKK